MRTRNRIAGVLSLAAATLAAAPATKPASQATTRPVIVLTADTAEQHGTLLATTRPGSTGAAYATGFGDADSRITWHTKTPQAGLYQAEIRYSASSIKGFDLAVNGVGHEGMFQPTGDAFATHAAGKVELKSGDNVIEIRRGWGFYDIDRVELIPTAVGTLKKPSAKLTDPDATPAARALMQKLVDDYGKSTRSGVVSIEDAELVHQRTGVWPAIMGTDLIEYSPSRIEFGAKPDRPAEKFIEDYKAGYLLTVMWHWNAPTKLINKKFKKDDGEEVDASWFFGFYTKATTFDIAETLKHPEGDDYKLLIRDIDAIAEQLKKYDAAGVPILWRPLHEADGGWFWWGAKGPDAFKALWSLLHERLTQHHKLHNLIWVYTASTKWDWYPPADEFDIIGIDAYPKDPRDTQSMLWDALQARWGEQKLIALTEIGGVPDIAAMWRHGIRWSYFASWGGDLGPKKVPADQLKKLYLAEQVQNRDAK